MSSASPSSSLVSSTFWSCALVVYIGCSCVVGWVVVVVLAEVMGRAGRVRLPFMKKLSIASHSEVSSAVVNQVMSLVKSMSCPVILVGCRRELMSSSHPLAGLPCLQCPFCTSAVMTMTMITQAVATEDKFVHWFSCVQVCAAHIIDLSTSCRLDPGWLHLGLGVPGCHDHAR